ncbi:hypothetical protein sos41_21150 [Alphaproteobacteria bacterium SO-S41]|nr:hypothetical protein sos41_21150 [Alphaproteobacteria bacterium SO-S41]
MDAPSLKGTDYVGRAYGFAFDRFWRVVPSILLWSLPAMAWTAWPIFLNESFMAFTSFLVRTIGLNGFIIVYGAATVVIRAACLAGFSVLRHRDLLAGITPLNRSAAASLPPYLGYWLLTVLTFAVILMLIGFTVGLVFGTVSRPLLYLIALVGIIVVGMLVLRAILVFPAIAIGDRQTTLVSAERATRGNGWRIFLGTVQVTVPTTLLLAIVLGLAGRYFVALWPDGTGLFIDDALQLLAEFVVATVFVSYVSLLYAHFNALPVPAPEGWEAHRL